MSNSAKCLEVFVDTLLCDASVVLGQRIRRHHFWISWSIRILKLWTSKCGHWPTGRRVDLFLMYFSQPWSTQAPLQCELSGFYMTTFSSLQLSFWDGYTQEGRVWAASCWPKKDLISSNPCVSSRPLFCCLLQLSTFSFFLDLETGPINDELFQIQLLIEPVDNHSSLSVIKILKFWKNLNIEML